MEHYYFAYGSNLFAPQMAALAPCARAVGPTTISDWELSINEHGVLSIRQSPGGVVHGLLWSCTASDLAALDRFEAVDEGLYVREVTIVAAHTTETAFVYRSVSTRTGLPRPGYLEIAVLPPMRSLAFPRAYIASVEALLEAGTAGEQWPEIPPEGGVFTG
jgi:gamma-glutamylcyclotransferase (GGCT)/AIG2-like uncharacterized protein YtfP